MVEHSIKDGLLRITLNNAATLNAFTTEVYDSFSQILQKANKDRSVKCILITSNSNNKSNYFSSGNDFTDAFTQDSRSHEERVRSNLSSFKQFVDDMIKNDIYTVVAVNGNAVGIAVTFLALCDYIVMGKNYTFWSPFSLLGLNAEGCSSYTFPRIFGKKAAKLLILNQIMTAQEAFECNYVNELVDQNQVIEKAEKVCRTVMSLSENSIRTSKRLMQERTKLLEVNANEMDCLYQLFNDPDTIMRIKKFFLKRARL